MRTITTRPSGGFSRGSEAFCSVCKERRFFSEKKNVDTWQEAQLCGWLSVNGPEFYEAVCPKCAEKNK